MDMASMTSSQSDSDVVDITDDGLDTSPSPSPPPPSKSIPTRVVRPVRPSKLKKNYPPAPASKVIPNNPSVTISAQEESCNIEKKCENPDCAAPTLISLVPTRSTVQFINNPTVVPDPLLVNGYTTVFEVGGITANINDMKAVRTPCGKIKYQPSEPIYRVVPNTHAHIVNYVIIDAEGETLKKIKQNDPETVKKLLESQKNSAQQLLEKLIGAKKSEAQAGSTTGSAQQPKPVMKVMTNALPTQSDKASTSTSTVAPLNVVPLAVSKNVTPLQKKVGTVPKVIIPVQQKAIIVPSSTPVITPIISSVMSVAQGSQVSSSGLPVVSNVESRNPAVLASSTSSAPTSTAAPTPATTSAVSLEQMQSELQALKETVKLLTEMKSGSAAGSEGGGGDPKKPRLA